MVQGSEELRRFLSDFVDELNRGDRDAAVSRLTSERELLAIGTGSEEWMEDAKAREAFRKEAGTLHAQFERVEAYEDGGFGWIAARGAITLPDGAVVPVRWSLMLRRGPDNWEIVHTHLSVPDDHHE